MMLGVALAASMALLPSLRAERVSFAVSKRDGLEVRVDAILRNVGPQAVYVGPNYHLELFLVDRKGKEEHIRWHGLVGEYPPLEFVEADRLLPRRIMKASRFYSFPTTAGPYRIPSRITHFFVRIIFDGGPFKGGTRGYEGNVQSKRYPIRVLAAALRSRRQAR